LSTQIPDHVPAHLAVEVDLVRDEQFRTDAYTALDRLSASGPILWTTADGGYWIPTRQADIAAVLKNFGAYASSAANTAHSGKYPSGLRGAPMRVDPPEHGKYRRLTAPLMSRRAMATREAHIRKEVVRLVSAIAPKGHCDIMTDLASPLGTGMAAEVIGIPADLGNAYHEWKTSFWRRESSSSQSKTGVNHDFVQEVLAQISRTRSDPHASETNSLIAHLLRSRLDGHMLTDTEVLDMALVFMLGAADTAIALIGLAFQFFAHHPEMRVRIVENPDQLPLVTEEILRMYSVVNTHRVATRDTELCGVLVKAGDRVLVSTALADRDPVTYPDPTTMSLKPRSPHHLAFGTGPHRCPGEHLGRLELRIVLDEFHRQIPHYEVATDAALRMTGAPVISIVNLPLIWSPVQGIHVVDADSTAHERSGR